MEISYLRQAGIITTNKLEHSAIALIGAGAVGSFTAIALAKMGVKNLEVFDEDGIAPHNIPNQFYPIADIGQFKVDSLARVISDFSNSITTTNNKNYECDTLKETVIVATDSMASRKLVWEQFLEQEQCHNYIEARMGAELGIVYTIQKSRATNPNREEIPEKEILTVDRKFYEETLYTDEQAIQLPCTARTIIYNVLMIASLICRAYKGIINNEEIPREQVFDMEHLTKVSYQIRE